MPEGSYSIRGRGQYLSIVEPLRTRKTWGWSRGGGGEPQTKKKTGRVLISRVIDSLSPSGGNACKRKKSDWWSSAHQSGISRVSDKVLSLG